MALARHRRTALDARGMKMLGCGPRGCRLRGVLLGFAKLGDRDGQAHQIRDERGRRQRGLAGDVAVQRHQARSGTQLVPSVGATGNPAVGRTGRAARLPTPGSRRGRAPRQDL
jgi:hypothetical protein